MTFRRNGLTEQIIDEDRGIVGTTLYAGQEMRKLIIEYRDGRIGTVGYSTEKQFPAATRDIDTSRRRIHMLTGSFISYFKELGSNDIRKNSEEVLYIFKLISQYYKLVWNKCPPIISTDYAEALQNKNRRVPLDFEIPCNVDLAVRQF